MNREKLDNIIEIAQASLKPAGFECLEVDWDEANELLRVYVDRAAGVDVQDRTEASHLLASVSCVPGLEAGAYTLEVSSPGLERPLRLLEHFQESLGEFVVLHLRAPLEGKLSLRGVLSQASSQELLMQERGQEYAVPLALVYKANIVFNWEL